MEQKQAMRKTATKYPELVARQSPLYEIIYRAVCDGIVDGLEESLKEARDIVERLEIALADLTDVLASRESQD